MKKYILSLVFCSDILLLMGQPGSWQQKSALGSNTSDEPSGRNAAVAFSIGNKGYVGTGDDGQCRNDFWQYDPVADTWTQKADVGGNAREYGVGFSIGGKGYIGLGDNVTSNFGDFWEYDTAANSWTQKGDFAGGARTFATAFTIGGEGYVGTGSGNTGYFNDFWAYDPVADSWTQKAAFGGDARVCAIGFSISGKGYIGTGNNEQDALNQSFRQDFWEYDPVADAWTQKANFGGGIRTQATGFSIGSKGYVGLGFSFLGSGNYNDFWQYDPVSDSWVQKINFAGSPRNGAAAFSMGANGYIVSGWDGVEAIPGIQLTGARQNDCWKYDTLGGSWTQISNFGVAGRSGAIGFGINGKGYLGMGSNGDPSSSGNLTDIWEYDTLANSWSQKASFPGGGRSGVIGFSIGTKGYAGLGDTAGIYLSDFWEFDPVLNTWTQKSSFGGGGREYPVGISIGTKGYAGLGYLNGTFPTDFWAFDPLTNTWTPVAAFAGTGRYEAVGFSVGNKGYIGLGLGVGLPDSTFWEYDPALDNWTQKSKYPGSSRSACVTFGIGSYGYVGLGSNSSNEFWQYDPAADSWTRQTGFAGGGRVAAIGFSIGNNGYVGTGEAAFSTSTGSALANDFWQYATQGVIRTVPGDYSVSSACPVLSGTAFTWAADSSNSLVFGIDPNNNNLGATCWGVRNVAAGNYRNSFGWFGGSQQLFGAYMPDNYLITPASQPDSAVTVRLYCTAAGLTDFVNSFNAAYGTAYTQNDIRIVRYDGINQDLDPTNNSNLATDYTAITPDSIGTYGGAGEYRYFEFATPGFSEFYLTLSSPTSPLAVNLLNFSAVYDTGVSLLHWQTAQEENSSHFDIQRSTDNRQYGTIGSVPAAGNSTSIRSYSFADLNAGALGVKTIYYRLVETDLDSQKVYSKIVPVNIVGTNNGISVIPNPATDIITVQLNTTTANDKASLIIADMTGRKMEVRNITLNTGDNTIPLSIQNLSAGVYIIVVTSNETRWYAKFVKQ